MQEPLGGTFRFKLYYSTLASKAPVHLILQNVFSISMELQAFAVSLFLNTSTSKCLRVKAHLWWEYLLKLKNKLHVLNVHKVYKCLFRKGGMGTLKGEIGLKQDQILAKQTLNLEVLCSASVAHSMSFKGLGWPSPIPSCSRTYSHSCGLVLWIA